MKIIETGSHDSFYNAILLGILSKLKENRHIFFEEKHIEYVLDKCFYDKLKGKKEGFALDLNLANFQQQCHEINDLLNEKRYFLKFYELKSKLRYIIKKRPRESKVQRDSSTCVEEQFNGFDIVRNSNEK